MTERQADKWACRLGLHPGDIWPELYWAPEDLADLDAGGSDVVDRLGSRRQEVSEVGVGGGEAALRFALRRHLESSPATLVQEFWLSVSLERADLVAVSPELLGCFEIKSAGDDLRRLRRQIRAYGRVFDRCSAVVAQRHAARVCAELPAWWSLIVVDEPPHADMGVVRVARTNPSAPELETFVRLLWKREAAAALARLSLFTGQQLRSWKSYSRAWMWNQLIQHADGDSVRSAVRWALVERARHVAAITPSGDRASSRSEVAVVKAVATMSDDEGDLLDEESVIGVVHLAIPCSECGCLRGGPSPKMTAAGHAHITTWKRAVRPGVGPSVERPRSSVRSESGEATISTAGGPLVDAQSGRL